MAENLQITRVSTAEDESSRVDLFSRETNEKLQAMGRSLVSALYMLVRSVKMYDPDNNVFEKPLAQLQDTMNQVIRKDGKLELWLASQAPEAARRAAASSAGACA